MKRIISEDKIPIKYLQKVNGGKHSAFKVALALPWICPGKLKIIYATELESISEALKSITDEWFLILYIPFACNIPFAKNTSGMLKVTILFFKLPVSADNF